MKYQAVIFDMDGVLVDTEKYWAGVEKKFFESRGVPFTKELAIAIMGSGDRDLIIWGKEKYGWPESSDALQEERDAMSEIIYTKLCVPLPGAEELLIALRKSKIKIALASSTVRRRIEIILNRFNWAKYFDITVSAEQIDGPTKPQPAIYLATAKKLNEQPGACLVIEDSLNGVRAAKSAGMTCVAVPEVKYQGESFNEADLVIQKLTDSELYSFLQLV